MNQNKTLKSAPRDDEYFSSLRTQFPALLKKINGKSAVFFDGPGGTQVSQRVIDAVSAYYATSNANSGGEFATSQETDEITERARYLMSQFLGCEADEIVFGANMTSLTFSFSRALGRDWKDGHEIITTSLDHDANVAPWKALEERGIKVHKADFNEVDCTLDLEDFARKLNTKTRLVAVGYASNALGTINDVKRITRMAHSVGALVYVDAVHYAPHGPIDVKDLDCDFLACSPYKFFAPHMGVVYAKKALLSTIRPYKVEPSNPAPPHCWETGTQNFELQSGLIAALEYLEDVGRSLHDEGSTRLRFLSAMTRIQKYERTLSEYFVPKLLSIAGVTLYGVTDAMRFASSTPTFGFNIQGVTPIEVCKALSNQAIFAWDGNFYALGVTERLGLESSGGMVRVGFVHYNTRTEIDRLLLCLATIAKKAVN